MTEHDGCPRCGGPPGRSGVPIQTWEYKDTTLVTGKDRYLVRTVTVPGICDACSGTLEKQRLAADLVCLVPLVVLFFVLVATDSKLWLVLLIGYLIYLARHLDYNWADSAIYGGELMGRLAAHVPEGDPGSALLPVSWGHMAVRILAIPAGLVALLTVAGALMPFVSRGAGRDASPPASASAARAYPADRVAHARAVFAERDLIVPVNGGKPAWVMREMGGKSVGVLTVWAAPENVPAGRATVMMAARQLCDAFLTSKSDTMLVIEGAGPTVALHRFEVDRIRKTLKP